MLYSPRFLITYIIKLIYLLTYYSFYSYLYYLYSIPLKYVYYLFDLKILDKSLRKYSTNLNEMIKFNVVYSLSFLRYFS